ncbi:hypothetical protein LBMAG53_21840 [Planctomycetota bacterium]|nr:hypothetical protein LBMAG53_21840 [Planctomycetota bacterium]
MRNTLQNRKNIKKGKNIIIDILKSIIELIDDSVKPIIRNITSTTFIRNPGLNSLFIENSISSAQRQRSPGRRKKRCKAGAALIDGSGASPCWATFIFSPQFQVR